MKVSFPLQGVYAICDNGVVPDRPHFEIARSLLKGGVKTIQLRMKGEKDLGKVEKVAREILKLKSEYDFRFILNDYVSLASDLDVDGVHVGKDDLSIEEAKRRLKSGCLVGYSSHSLEEARRAQELGADLIAFGAIFPTANKGPDHPIQGLQRLRAVVQACPTPIVAIGGIGRGNFHSVAQTDVAAIAMISALVAADSIEREAKWFVEAWEHRGLP